MNNCLAAESRLTAAVWSRRRSPGGPFSALLSCSNLKNASMTAVLLEHAVAASADFTGANIKDSNLTRITAPGSVFLNAVLATVRAEYADLSRCDFSGAAVSASILDRATLWQSTMTGSRFAGCSFEFADLRSIRGDRSDFSQASFLGADLRGARLHRCVLREADFYWADLSDCELIDCDTEGARFPETVHIAYGPRNAFPPHVVPVPLYRAPATEEDYAQMVSTGLDDDSEPEGARA